MRYQDGKKKSHVADLIRCGYLQLTCREFRWEELAGVTKTRNVAIGRKAHPAVMPNWPEDLQYSIEVMDGAGKLLRMLGEPTRAAYEAVLRKPRPAEETVVLCWKGQVLLRSDRVD
jgi:hypothetical protein